MDKKRKLRIAGIVLCILAVVYIAVAIGCAASGVSDGLGSASFVASFAPLVGWCMIIGVILIGAGSKGTGKPPVMPREQAERIVNKYEKIKTAGIIIIAVGAIFIVADIIIKEGLLAKIGCMFWVLGVFVGIFAIESKKYKYAKTVLNNMDPSMSTPKYTSTPGTTIPAKNVQKVGNPVKNAVSNSMPESSESIFGTFSFDEEEREKIKRATFKYVQGDLFNCEKQLDLLKSLKNVLPIAVVEVKAEMELRRFEAAPESEKEEAFKKAIVEMVLGVENIFGVLNLERIVEKIAQISGEELLKVWAVLNYYAELLKPEFTGNIQHLRDYIHSQILDRDGKVQTQSPVRQDGQSIYIDSKLLSEWKKNNLLTLQYEFYGSIPLNEKENVITFYEDGEKGVEYCIQTEGDEDFSGKYLHISVRVGYTGVPELPTMQVDGFVSADKDAKEMTSDDIGYRMEGYYLKAGGEASMQRREAIRGQDLVAKGLKYQGYTTPSNVRLIGVCPECGKSFAFHGYAFYMGQQDVAYSDDGMDCCAISEYNIDKDTWSYETEGKTFRYYNSFACPHCRTPYIDYKKYPQNKVFGVSGCVHLGKKYYQA